MPFGVELWICCVVTMVRHLRSSATVSGYGEVGGVKTKRRDHLAGNMIGVKFVLQWKSTVFPASSHDSHPSAPRRGVLRQPKKQLEHRAGAVLPLTSCEWPIRHSGKVTEPERQM